MALAQEGVVAGFEDQGTDHKNENPAHKTGSMFERHVGAQQAAHHIGDRQWQGEMPPDMAFVGEENQRCNVRRYIE